MNSHELAGRDYGGGNLAILTAGMAASISIGVARGDGAVDDAYQIRVLSSRRDMITAGDALIGISAPQDADRSGLGVFLDGADVTGAFRSSSTGSLVGLVEGIAGAGKLSIADAGGISRGTLSLVNHPVEGPVFSGPHQHPELVDPDDYAVRFASKEMHRLRRIFPEGVCDWGRRGVGQTDLNGTWQTFR